MLYPKIALLKWYEEFLHRMLTKKVQFVGIWHSTAFQKVLNALSNSNVKEIMAPPFVLLYVNM